MTSFLFPYHLLEDADIFRPRNLNSEDVVWIVVEKLTVERKKVRGLSYDSRYSLESGSKGFKNKVVATYLVDSPLHKLEVSWS